MLANTTVQLENQRLLAEMQIAALNLGSVKMKKEHPLREAPFSYIDGKPSPIRFNYFLV